MKKVSIVSGWSNPGGSTTSFINLCNLFNERGIDCTFYGPHMWHLDQCKSGLLNEGDFNEESVLIVHFMNLDRNLKVKRVILSCHEKDIFPLKNIPHDHFDKIQFITKEQKEWHGIDHPSVIIPNVYDNLTSKWPKEETKAAGVIGTVDPNKNTHVSIQRALDDGYKEVHLYGQIVDNDYFDGQIKPLLSESVIFHGHERDKQKMYDSIDAAYLSSNSEVAPLVKGECALTSTKFMGNENTQGGEDTIVGNDKIFDMWMECLEF